MKNSPVSAVRTFYNAKKTSCMAALSVLLCGMVTHLYMLTNKFYNYFEMGNIFSKMPITQEDTLAMGRVFLPFVTSISTNYSSAMINGILAFVMIGAAAFMLVDMLKICNVLYAVLCGAVMVTFPGVASYLSYGINTDVFCGSILLAVCSVYVTEKYRRGWILGIFLLGISVGTYQPFMSVAIAVMYLLLFVRVMQEDISWKDLIAKAVKYVLVLAAGFVFYYICLQIALKATGITMGNYHGVNEMTSFTVRGIVKGFVYAYGYFFAYFFTVQYTNSIFALIVNAAAALSFFVLLVCRMQRGGKEYRTRRRIGQLSLMVIFLPLGLNAAPFLMADRVGNGVDRYMMFSVVMVYVLLMKLADTAEGRKDFERSGLCGLTLWVAAASVFLTVISCYYVCNMAYHRLDATTQSVDHYLNRIAADLEKTDEWKEGRPVYFAGARDFYNTFYDVEIKEFGKPSKIEGTEMKPWYNYGALVKYMKEYLHVPIIEPSQEQIDEILASQELKEMEIYPQQDSIRLINGVLVVKLNHAEERK